MSRGHVQSPLPQPGGHGASKLNQYREALTLAENHLAWVKANAPGNALGVRNSEKVIAQYKRIIAELESEDWLK